ncbi:response regulator [Phototrophicus methaneseepsis]|uniref:response regulator transcription factor n=1 Tax=Phototrophicus methaneseepsis TaxID=2710758 RepID=UPI001E2AA6B3|nr:response regulator [Phototrophicus methaneseepsis]
MLIADDHETARIGIRKALMTIEDVEQVVDARNGDELIEALEHERFDFLILDVSMPHFDPLITVQSIRDQYPSMFILIVSAFDDDVYVQGLLNAGVHGYHLKDQPLSDVTQAIARILSGETWVSGPLVNKLLRSTNRRSIELSPRQVDIARGLSNSLSNKEIAEELSLSIKTVENHLTRLYRQLNVNSRLEAMAYIHENSQLLGQRGQSIYKKTSSSMPLASGEVSIIVADDNQRYRRELCGIVGRNSPGATIYEAGSWRELYPLVEQVHPRLIFMDIVLGDEDGISHTRKIKQKLHDVKIVLITAYPDREFHRLGIESGALAMIDKKDLDTPTIRQILLDVID